MFPAPPLLTVQFPVWTEFNLLMGKSNAFLWWWQIFNFGTVEIRLLRINIQLRRLSSIMLVVSATNLPIWILVRLCLIFMGETPNLPMVYRSRGPGLGQAHNLLIDRCDLRDPRWGPLSLGSFWDLKRFHMFHNPYFNLLQSYNLIIFNI